MIFSLITLDDIKFEIMIFDSTSIGSDNVLNIINEINTKNCLKTTDNIFILNKIDQINKMTEEEIINEFKQYFYQNFEDDKNEKLLPINLNKNIFIPMNSLLLLSESKISEDFGSLLKAEFFAYIEVIKRQQLSYSFYEYLKIKI